MTVVSTDRRRVLVVDDEPTVLDLLTELLEGEGYETAAAGHGGAALALIASFEPEIVISDVVMPGIDGVELCRRIKLNAATENIPVLLISGASTSESDVLAGLKAGADDYLELPFRHEQFLVKVAHLSERCRM